MYGELTLTFKTPMSRAKTMAVLENMIDGNLVSAQSVVSRASFPVSARLALCAEQVSSSASIVYFQAGLDTVIANIFAKSISQIRTQCERIVRQLALQGLRTKKVSANIYLSADMEILRGEQISLGARYWDALKERFVGKFIPPLATVFLASMLLGGTPAFISAQIGLVAASFGALVDALLVATTAEAWKWRELK